MNTVVFSTDAGTMEKISSYFLIMAQREELSGKAVLPAGYPGNTGYLFEVQFMDGTLNYLSRYSPNVEVIVYIAEQFKADFVYVYEELNMGIYGEAIYQNGILKDTFLEPQDFGCYGYNKVTGMYTFEGNSYLHEFQIYDLLLDRKRGSH